MSISERLGMIVSPICCCSSVVEHFIGNEEVGGPTPLNSLSILSSGKYRVERCPLGWDIENFEVWLSLARALR